MSFDSYPGLALLMTIDEDGDKRWSPVGTGFFCLVQPYLVLVTAAHLFNGNVARPLYAVGPLGAVSLAKGKVIRSQSVDLALAILPSKEVAAAFGEVRCPPIDILENPIQGSLDALYRVHGFPTSKVQVSRISGLSSNQVGLTLGRLKERPSRCVLPMGAQLLCFDLDPKKLLDENFQHTQSLGSFRGLSGGPVLKHVLTEDGILPGKLSGVFLEWHRQERTAVVLPALFIDLLIKQGVEL